MITIDAHGHVSAPAEVYEYQAKIVANRAPMRPPALTTELLQPAMDQHVALLDMAGVDLQLISPRPYMMMHSLFNPRLVAHWTRYVNDVIAAQVALRPDRLRGIAGLPQFRLDDPRDCLGELERCVTELGFVGCLLNPDPMEGDAPAPPGLGDPFWYPVYEKLCELDVPMLIHSASCGTQRELHSIHFINEETIAVASLANSDVFDRFPDLKVVVGHGGGAVPYQLGRFRAAHFRRGTRDVFVERMRQMYFDTCVYSVEGLELLFKVVGTDRCVFGTEIPGSASVVDPVTGNRMDVLKPVIESIGFLSAADKADIFANNAQRLYKI
ncbi:amidohydrolase family protein [Dactylosporangium sp. NPDC049525]|uniref:amidohydrolase family protein n=1 Tax=Dactylosporangium sp. NPDC049525 TaxID=3154730 RepID=UPI00341DB6CE